MSVGSEDLDILSQAFGFAKCVIFDRCVYVHKHFDTMLGCGKPEVYCPHNSLQPLVVDIHDKCTQYLFTVFSSHGACVYMHVHEHVWIMEAVIAAGQIRAELREQVLPQHLQAHGDGAFRFFLFPGLSITHISPFCTK